MVVVGGQLPTISSPAAPVSILSSSRFMTLRLYYRDKAVCGVEITSSFRPLAWSLDLIQRRVSLAPPLRCCSGISSTKRSPGKTISCSWTLPWYPAWSTNAMASSPSPRVPGPRAPSFGTPVDRSAPCPLRCLFVIPPDRSLARRHLVRQSRKSSWSWARGSGWTASGWCSSPSTTLLISWRVARTGEATSRL